MLRCNKMSLHGNSIGTDGRTDDDDDDDDDDEDDDDDDDDDDDTL
jgi:hypothetical protein